MGAARAPREQQTSKISNGFRTLARAGRAKIVEREVREMQFTAPTVLEEDDEDVATEAM